MGVIKGAKGAVARVTKGWDQVEAKDREDLLMCGCGKARGGAEEEYQDAYHVAMVCGHTSRMRERAVEAAYEAVSRVGSSEDKEAWNKKEWEGKLRHTLSTKKEMSVRAEKEVRQKAAVQWVHGISKVEESMEGQARSFQAAIAAKGKK